MGFMDKLGKLGNLEELGNKLGEKMKKMAIANTTHYGVIRTGDYKDAYIALGDPPTKTTSTDRSHSQLLIVSGDEELARFNIDEEIEEINYIKTIQFPATGKDGYQCTITYTDGNGFKAFVVDLLPSHLVEFNLSMYKKMTEETWEFFNKVIEMQLHS